MRRHPLENPSLAPYGLVAEFRQRRLDYKPTWGSSVNGERLIARLWDHYNRTRGATRPLPVKTIIHDILPGQARVNRLESGDFSHEGLPYLTRDIVVLSGSIQWFGTNVGSAFLEPDRSISTPLDFRHDHEFLLKFARADERRDMASFLVHDCNEQCGKELTLIGWRCHVDPNEASQRDRAVIDGLMRWLGRSAGRAFIADYHARIKRACAADWERRVREAGLCRKSVA